jgi:hypothetical protein
MLRGGIGPPRAFLPASRALPLALVVAALDDRRDSRRSLAEALIGASNDVLR